MIRRASLPLLAGLAATSLAAGLAGVPTAASAAAATTSRTGSSTGGTGGVGMNGSGGASGSAGSSGTAGGAGSSGARVRPANTPVSASGDGITVRTSASGILRHVLRFTGTVPTSDAGQVIEIERTVHPGVTAWLPTAHATVDASGRFSVVWRANRAGRFAVEAVLTSPASVARASRSRNRGTSPPPGGGTGSAAPTPAPSGPVSPALTITVFRPAVASIYGPGFWGHRTACGQTLWRRTLGVASRTLRCGTRVSVLYGGHVIVVPVIDRGPYARGITWDLTAATARALGMTGTARVGAAPGA